jgi:exopolysaccharide biosynthesis polyprenyl glycosylphosphotransferase
LSWELGDRGIELLAATNLTDVAERRVAAIPTAGVPLVHVRPPRVLEAAGLSKRVLDIVASLAAIVLLAPIGILIAMLIKLEDGGPVFFSQTRVGRQGRPFQMLKFRSMVPDAECALRSVRELNHCDAVRFKVKDDPRVTRVGRVLRRYSLDELPQFIQALSGKMSIVGPRPALPAEIPEYEPDDHRRLMVRPGITGLWQVSGRSDLCWKESVRLDLYYVDNWSMTMDLRILVSTVKAVFSSQGAY